MLKTHLSALPPDEVQALFKVADKGIAFLDKAAGYSQTNPEFAPKHLDLEEFKTDHQGAEDLMPLVHVSEQITDLLKGSVTLSRSEAAVAALSYYQGVRRAAEDGVSGAQTIYDDLSQRFPGRPKKQQARSGSTLGGLG